MKIEITSAQLEAIKNMSDDVSGMIGGGDSQVNKNWNHYVRIIDRMLEKNNLPPRGFK